MKTLMLTAIAGCMSMALAVAYAAEADKKGPVSVPETGAIPPKGEPGAAPKGKAAASAPAPAPAPAASATTSPGGAAASATTGMDPAPKGRARRAARAEKG